MDKLIKVIGDGASIVGVLVCLFAGLSRAVGNRTLGGYESMTLLTVGIAIMLIAILAKLYRIENR